MRFLWLLLLLTAGCRQEIPFEQLPKTEPERIKKCLDEAAVFHDHFSGSENIKRYADWIRRNLSGCSKFKIYEQYFKEQTPAGEIHFRNIIAEIPGCSSRKIIVGAHYDAKHLLSVPGFQAANDGTSGVIALLAMIRVLQNYSEKPPLTVCFVFFDGEEALYNYTDNDGLHGSRYFAKTINKEECRAMILLDMIGDKDLNFTLPANSSPDLLRIFQQITARHYPQLRWSNFPNDMLDDHVPFLQKGIPALDLIDFEYGPNNCYWHTEGDTFDKISVESIKLTADLTLAMIWRLAGR